MLRDGRKARGTTRLRAEGRALSSLNAGKTAESTSFVPAAPGRLRAFPHGRSHRPHPLLASEKHYSCPSLLITSSL